MTESHNATRRRLSAGAAWTGARAHLRAHRACHANAAGDASPLQQPVEGFRGRYSRHGDPGSGRRVLPILHRQGSGTNA